MNPLMDVQDWTEGFLEGMPALAGRQLNSLQADKKKVPKNYTHIFKVLAQHSFVGAILGKGGANTAAIQRDTHCEIFASRKDDLFPGTDFRVVFCCAESKESLRAGVQRVLQIVQELGATATHPKVKAECFGQNENQIRFRFLMPKPACGSLIGKGGETINHLRQQLGVSIDITRDSVSYGPVLENAVELVGHISQLDDVLSHVFSCLEASTEHDWYQTWLTHHGTWRTPGAEGNDSRTRGVLGSSNFVQSVAQDASVVGVPRQKRSRGELVELRGQQNGVNGNLIDQAQRLSSSGNVPMQVAISTKIPAVHAGAVIGPAGKHIKEIMRISGANVKLYDVDPQAPEERELEIKGHAVQVSTAMMMAWSNLMEKMTGANTSPEEQAIKNQISQLNSRLNQMQNQGL